jgi:hypothetical protein
VLISFIEFTLIHFTHSLWHSDFKVVYSYDIVLSPGSLVIQQKQEGSAKYVSYYSVEFVIRFEAMIRAFSG